MLNATCDGSSSPPEEDGGGGEQLDWHVPPHGWSGPAVSPPRLGIQQVKCQLGRPALITQLPIHLFSSINIHGGPGPVSRFPSTHLKPTCTNAHLPLSHSLIKGLRAHGQCTGSPLHPAVAGHFNGKLKARLMSVVCRTAMRAGTEDKSGSVPPRHHSVSFHPVVSCTHAHTHVCSCRCPHRVV